MIDKQITSDMPTQQLIKEFSVKPRGAHLESSLIESLRGVRNYTPLPSEVREKNSYIETIAREWFSQRMRKKYDELSPEIFGLKRDLQISGKHFKDRDGSHGDSDMRSITIPMLLQAELGKEEGWKDNYKYSDYHHNYELSLSSRMPRIPFDVRKAGRESLVFAYRTFSDALDTEVLGDVITEHPEYVIHPDNARLVVLWKPKPSDIHVEAKVIDNDPALVLKWDKPYLVSTWKEPDEEPFVDILNACKMVKLDNFLEG